MPTELDALIAYLQMLGTLVDFAKFDAAGPNLQVRQAMTYEAASRAFAESWSLVLFVALFIAVVVYAFWPGNKKQFDEAAQAAARWTTTSRTGDGR